MSTVSADLKIAVMKILCQIPTNFPWRGLERIDAQFFKTMAGMPSVSGVELVSKDSRRLRISNKSIEMKYDPDDQG